MKAGHPGSQWEWHEAYRDQTKNMYRTAYSDMAHFHETHVRSDFPSGYGGHIPAIRHDVLHRNTQFDRNKSLMRADPSRDAMPSFDDQLAGLPTATKFPCGSKNNPTLYVIDKRESTTEPRPPWGILTGKVQPLTQRHVPTTMKKSLSSPALQSTASAMMQSPMSPTAMMPTTGMGNVSPGERVRRTVFTANEEAKQGAMPSEAEVLAEQMRM